MAWPIIKLGEICEERKDKNVKNENLPVFTVSHIYGLIPYQNIFYKQIHSKNTTNYKIVNHDDFVFGLPTKNTLPFGYLDKKDKVLVSPAYVVFLIKNKNLLFPKFLFYLFKTDYYKWRIIEIAKSQSATRHGLPLKFHHLSNLEIPLPPLSVQEKIVKILDAIQEAVDIQEKIIEKTKELKKSMMANLFKYGGPSFRKERKLKKTEIGEIPENWEVARLGEVIEIFDSKRIPLSEEQRRDMKGKYPYCGANGIIDYINNYIFDGEYVLLAEDGGYWGPFEESAYIMKGKFWVNNHAHIFKAIENKTINFFLMNVLNYLDLNDYISGATRGKLNQSIMKDIKIPLPPLSEQQEIAEILQTIDQKIEIEKKKKELYEELFKTMLNKIMNQEIDIEKVEI